LAQQYFLIKKRKEGRKEGRKGGREGGREGGRCENSGILGSLKTQKY
jgi:hypothetical protein